MVLCTMVGKAWRQECEVAGHSEAVDMKDREKKASDELTWFFLASPARWPVSEATHT